MFGKYITKRQLKEIHSAHNLVQQEKLKYEVVKQNTLLVKRGKDWVKTQEGVVKLLEQVRDDHITRCLRENGVTGPASIDLITGKISIKKNNEQRTS